MLGIKAPGSGANKTAKIREVRSWARELHGISEETTIMVTELTCTEPGCPPVETVVAVLAEGGTRQAKVHRALAEVTRQDVEGLVFRAAEKAGGHS